MAHMVTCVYCSKKFDRDKIPYEQISAKRYAHKECAEKEKERLKKEEEDKTALENYILKLLNESYISPRVRKQINQYINEYKFSYTGIRKALVYFYEIQGNSIEKANGGIGIVPYIYKDAYNYYYSLWLAKQKNENKIIETFLPKEKEVHILNPQRKIKKRKLFSFLDEEEINGE